MAELPDHSKLLEELKREVIESRNMTIKTDNALKTLLAELKTVSNQQHAFQTKTWFASGVAYLLFTGLCVVGVVAISNARVASANTERERLEKQVAQLDSSIEKLKTDQAGQQAAEQGAMQAYKMMVTLPGEDRLKGLEAMARLDQARLPVFARMVLLERSAALKKEIGQGILEKGKVAFRRNEFSDAVAHLNRFLTMSPAEDEAAEASFFLGNALFQLRRFEEATKPLARFVDQDKRAKVRDFAMVMLMQSYDMVGKREESLAVARDGYATYPGSDYRQQFYLRMQRPGSLGVASPQAPSGPGAAANAPAPVVRPTTSAPSTAHPAGDAGLAPAPAWKPAVGPLPIPGAQPR